MTFKKSLLKASSFMGAVAGLSSCGNGQDPLSLIDPTVDPIEVSLPYSGITGLLTSGTTERFVWTLTFSGTQAQITAPASGVVTDVNLDGNTYDITLRVNSRFSVKLGSMTTLANVREGNVITAGTLIGNTTSAVSMSVYDNGIAVCMLPYLSDTARNTLTGVTAAAICQ